MSSAIIRHMPHERTQTNIFQYWETNCLRVIGIAVLRGHINRGRRRYSSALFHLYWQLNLILPLTKRLGSELFSFVIALARIPTLVKGLLIRVFPVPKFLNRRRKKFSIRTVPILFFYVHSIWLVTAKSSSRRMCVEFKLFLMCGCTTC
jgi:hypothetical protein